MAGASADASTTDLAVRSTLGAMDAAAEYLRRNLWRVLPAYAVGMVPYSLVMLMIIDVVTSEHRSALAEACMLLTAATVWRWVWVAVAQRRMQEDLTRKTPLPLRRQLPAILLLRLYAFVAMTWGAILIVPVLYGVFMAGFATPLVLDRTEPVWARVRATLAWMNRSVGRLSKIAMTTVLLTFLMLIGYAVIHGLMIGTILPSFLGLNVSDLSITLNSYTWLLCVGYFIFVAYDFYWMVLCVVVFYTIESAREGSDLRLRLNRLVAEGSA